MLALAKYEADIHRCGFHKSVLEDPENNVMVPDHDDCAMCAAIAVQHRVATAEDQAFLKAQGDKPDPRAKRPSDGRELFMRPASPGELKKRARDLQRRRQRPTRRR